MISELYLVETNKSYFSKSTGRNEANILAGKVVIPKNIRGIPGTGQHDTHFSGNTKALYLLFGSEIVLLPSVGLVNPKLKTRQNMRLFKRRFFGNTLKCKKLNERLWIYNMVNFLKIPILRDTNATHKKFIWGG